MKASLTHAVHHAHDHVAEYRIKCYLKSQQLSNQKNKPPRCDQKFKS